ncbi:MAG: metallophosphoesterase [Phycisphaerae bacterium]|nr:MAG: metallophosphoesterase [Phycisphaerae bacterium]
MGINILCAGDVVGNPGRKAIAHALPKFVKERDVACAIVNAENISSGSGITPALFEKLLKSGVDLVTLGDHIYRRREIIATLETSPQIVKPANLPPTAPGREFAIHETENGTQVAVFSILGRLYMKPQADCPFKAADRVLAKIPSEVKIIVCDMHAEATSEKVAMGWHLDGRVSILYGTHTHIPTADERVLPGGTGYITDLGMTGPYDGVLGRDKSRVLQAMVHAIPTRFDVATDDVNVCGIIASVDPNSGRCESIERIKLPYQES